jgi:hypothetical protein
MGRYDADYPVHDCFDLLVRSSRVQIDDREPDLFPDRVRYDDSAVMLIVQHKRNVIDQVPSRRRDITPEAFVSQYPAALAGAGMREYPT